MILRVFFRSHGAAVLGADLRPDPLGKDRPGKPAQVTSQIVQATKIVGNRVAIVVHDREQILCGRLDERLVADRIERFRAEDSRAAFLRRRDPVGTHLAHDRHPGARVHLRIVRGKIRARHGEIQCRQPVRFVLNVKQLFRRLAVFGAQAALLAGFVVLPIEDTVRSLEETVFVEHGVISGCEIARRTLPSLPSTRAVEAESRRNSALVGRPCWQIRWQMASFEAFRRYVTL